MPNLNLSQTRFNIATVVLLICILAAFITMPRYNYGFIAGRLATLDAKCTALENGFNKLNILAGPDEASRAAVVGNIDVLATALNKLGTDFVSVLENLAAHSSMLDDIQLRIGSVGETARNEDRSAGDGTANGSVPPPLVRAPDDLEPIDFDVSPLIVAQMDFESFLDLLAERTRILGHSDDPVAGRQVALPEAKRSRAQSLFVSFQACIEVISKSEYLFVQELVEKATRTAQYVEEVPREDKKQSYEATRQAGTLFFKVLPDGSRREFRFAAEDHPEFLRFDNLRQSALKSLLVSLSALSSS